MPVSKSALVSGWDIGQCGGVRVIYFVRTAASEIWLLVVSPKSEQDNIPSHLLKAVREEIENG